MSVRINTNNDKGESVRGLTVCMCMILGLFSSVAGAEIKLGAAQLPTFIDDGDKPARINAIMREAFSRMEQDVTLEVMRPAFLGSGLLSGQIDGHYAFVDLDEKKSAFLYSKPYLPLYLFAISKHEAVISVAEIEHLMDRRVAIENRFANTDKVRLIKDIKWARNPSTFDAFKQLADDRSYYLMSSRLLVDEFNRLLRSKGEQLLHFSKVPLITAGFRLAMSSGEGNQAVVEAFNSTIDEMQNDGTFNELLNIAWLTKDIDGDGTAEFITSRAVAHPKLEAGALTLAYPLDTSSVSDASTFYINGETASDWQQALSLMKDVTPVLRPSLLDEEVYQQILSRW